MKRPQQLTLIASALACVLVCTPVQAQQVPIPTTAAQVPGPASGTAMTKEYVQTIGRMAYLWGWPLVNSVNRSIAFSKAPEPGLVGGTIPFAFNQNAMLTGYISPNQTFIACPNQDVALLDDLVRPQQQRLRNRDPERLGRLEVDDQLELRRLLDGKVGGFGALEDPIHVGGGLPVGIENARPVRHETPGLHTLPDAICCRQAAPGCEVCEPCSMGAEDRI
jgi:hypothetical protein